MTTLLNIIKAVNGFADHLNNLVLLIRTVRAARAYASTL